MLSSIHPFGERARNQRYGTTATAFVIGSIGGGAVLGGALALGSTIFQGVGTMPGVAMVMLMAAAIWDLARLPVPSLSRQVDENWLPRYRGWVYGLGFGFQLGMGFATYVKSALTYGLALAAIVAGSPPLALFAGLAFGLVRGLSILLTSQVQTPEQLRRMFNRLGQTQMTVRLASGTGVAMIALIGLAQLS